MDIVIEIQGFRDISEKFMPKEVAVVAIHNPFVGHWIIIPPHPFDELPEKSKRENNWVTRNYHGIEWFDGETHQKCFMLHLREITRHAYRIYTRGYEKASYLQNLLSRSIYNLEDISPTFRDLPEEEKEGGRLCCYHGFGKFTGYHCALRNACKLKRWILLQKSRVCIDTYSDYTQNSRESDNDSVGDYSNAEKNNLNVFYNVRNWVNEGEKLRKQDLADNKEVHSNIELAAGLNASRNAAHVPGRDLT